MITLKESLNENFSNASPDYNLFLKNLDFLIDESIHLQNLEKNIMRLLYRDFLNWLNKLQEHLNTKLQQAVYLLVQSKLASQELCKVYIILTALHPQRNQEF